MRIATLTNWAYGASVVLGLLSGVTMLAAAQAEERERSAVEQRAQLDSLTAAVEEDSFRATDQARLYAISGDPVHIIVYQRDAATLKAIETKIVQARDAGAQPTELEALRAGLTEANQLADEQEAAIAAVKGGDSTTAHKIMFGAEYQRDLDRAGSEIARFQYMLD